MAGKHRAKKARRFSVAMVSAATATATALTVGVEPAPDPANRTAADDIDLAAAIQLLPDSGQYPNAKTYPDLTGGLGSAVNDASQAVADQFARAVVNGLSLTALAQAAGIDPQSLVNGLLADLPAGLLAPILASLGQSISLPVLGPVLDGLNLEYLTEVFELIGLPAVTNQTLTGVLALIGWNLNDPLNLAGLNVPGLNVVTAGPTFAVLKMLGIDLGWVPTQPNSVADEINGSPYLELGADGVLDMIFAKLNGQNPGGPLGTLLGSLGLGGLTQLLGNLTQLINQIRNPITDSIPDLLHARVVPSVGIGLGAFAIAMAYQQVIDDLANQPGGSNYTALTGEVNPILGSLTVLPMILVNNPGRPDGGMFARFGPLAALFGIDTVNPRTELTGEGGLLGNDADLLGLHLGGANVLPILVDVSYEYQPMSDFAAWPNPVTLANNLAAALMPTYMLRGLQLDGLGDQVGEQLGAALGDVAAGKPLALNLYLTLDSATLPLLEPLYLTADALNVVGLSPFAQVPMRLANALAPALSILTDLGYSNVKRNPDGTYTRDFSDPGEEVPFMSFPDVDPIQAMGDVLNALVAGFVKELGPNPTPGTPNALKTLLDAVLGGDLGGLFNGGLNVAPQSIASVPDTNARMMSFTTDEKSDDGKKPEEQRPEEQKPEEQKPEEQKPEEQKPEEQKPEEQKPEEQKPEEQKPEEQKPTAEQDEQKPEAEQPKQTEEKKGPRHAKPDAGDDEAEASKPTAPQHNRTPRHAKPERNVVRDSANFSPKAEDTKDSGTGDKKDAEPPAAAAAGDPADGAAAA